ncbi:DUF2254 domain-containing protein [Fictibacillus nanhaiensis]|uniref:DUF2254 domain-containing protein n=1 Tax=Fictibacillus nanhaiensis TaxID=742169 RepID=UPI001C989E73|nr:DUF2254 domain-containing protein [Fictibacillus nanhaiensis]MBY6037485.1 DUF2254 domain-containing protein [Fictibacillus nanhaiensis]
MILKMLLKMRQNIWVIPSIYSVVSVILAFITIYIDSSVDVERNSLITKLLFTEIDLAQTILVSIAPSLLTMTTFTFSIIMVVLTTYSSQYSPRTLPTFMTDRITMRILVFFMGSFIYSVITLLFMKNSISEPYVVSATICIMLAIICLAFFAFFIHHVGTFIQVSKLVERLTSEGLEVLDELDEMESHKRMRIEDYTFAQSHCNGNTIITNKHGYLQLIDHEGLTECAEKNQLKIDILCQTGDFLTQDQPVMMVFSDKEVINDELKEYLLSYMTFGRERSVFQDIGFSTQKLVEIALRAISPGINDPNTANQCILNIGRVLAKAGEKKDGYMVFFDSENEPRLTVPKHAFKEVVYHTFYQIRHYGKEDISVILTIYDALTITARYALAENKKIVWDFEKYVEQGIQKEVLQQLDLEYIAKRKHELAKLTGNAHKK